MPTLLFTFDASLTPLLPVAQRERPAARAWPEGATLKHAIETFGVPHTEVGVVQVDGHAALLDALLPARGAVAVAGVRAALPDAPLHFLCDAHLGATARLLRMAGFDTAYDNNYADATIEALADTEDWIVLSRDRELLKRRGIRRGAFIRARAAGADARDRGALQAGRSGAAVFALPGMQCAAAAAVSRRSGRQRAAARARASASVQHVRRVPARVLARFALGAHEYLAGPHARAASR